MRRLFGDRPTGAVSLVEVPVARVYARRARVAFFVTAVSVGTLTGVGLSAAQPASLAVLAGVLAGVVCGLAAGIVVRLWPVLRALWHWSGEIALVALLAKGASALSAATHPSVVVAVAVTLAGGVWCVRPLRRRVVAWWWCAVVRHRLRLCFAEFIRSANRVRPGSLPLILLARPTLAGERVWVWLRPGLELADLEGRTGKMAVACWAGAVRVVRASPSYAALIRVDVTRRDPLTGLVVSPLAAMVGEPAEGKASMPVPVPLGLDLPDVPEEIPAPRGPRGSGSG